MYRITFHQFFLDFQKVGCQLFFEVDLAKKVDYKFYICTIKLNYVIYRFI